MWGGCVCVFDYRNKVVFTVPTERTKQSHIFLLHTLHPGKKWPVSTPSWDSEVGLLLGEETSPVNGCELHMNLATPYQCLSNTYWLWNFSLQWKPDRIILDLWKKKKKGSFVYFLFSFFKYWLFFVVVLWTTTIIISKAVHKKKNSLHILIHQMSD